MSNSRLLRIKNKQNLPYKNRKASSSRKISHLRSNDRFGFIFAFHIRLSGEYIMPSKALCPSASVITKVNCHLSRLVPPVLTCGNFINTLFQPFCRCTAVGRRAVRFSLVSPRVVLSIGMVQSVCCHSGAGRGMPTSLPPGVTAGRCDTRGGCCPSA